MRDIVVLAKDAAQVAAAEEDGAGAVVACDAGLFAKVRADDVHFHIGADEAVAGLLEAIDGAEAWAEIAVAQVGVGEGAFAGGVNGREEVVTRNVVVEKEGRCEMEGPGWDAVAWDKAMAMCRCEERMGSDSRPQARY